MNYDHKLSVLVVWAARCFSLRVANDATAQLRALRQGSGGVLDECAVRAPAAHVRDDRSNVIGGNLF